MSEAPELNTGKSAGALLREARIAQGLHIAALAAAIKVAPRKLELIEADRYSELPDATFARALAQTMCRVLKIDAEPVLSRLPQAKIGSLDHVASGLNAPFRERPGRHEPRDWSLLGMPVVWGTALLLIAAVGVYLLPPGLLMHERAVEPSAPAASQPVSSSALPLPEPASAAAPTTPVPAPQAPASVAASSEQSVASAAPVAAVSLAQPPAAAAAAPLQLRTTAESWVQVTDAHGKVLLARTLQAGESLGLDGALPLRVRIGNASATQVSFRGEPVRLAAARDNTAKIELK
jgi:cytoskeleton protein RodZ